LDEALVELRKSVALNPVQTTAVGRVAEVYLYQGKTQLSLDEERRSPSIVNVPIMEFNRTWALIDLGRFDDAARLIQTGFENSKAGAGGLKHAVSALLAARQGNRRAAGPRSGPHWRSRGGGRLISPTENDDAGRYLTGRTRNPCGSSGGSASTRPV